MTERAINAEPWTTAARDGEAAVHRLLLLVRRTASPGTIERCPSIARSGEQQRAARAATLARPHTDETGSQPCRQQFSAG